MKDKTQIDVGLSLRLSRYTFLRYMTSIIFFICLYWFILNLPSKAPGKLSFPIILGLIMIYINKELFALIKTPDKTKIDKTIKSLFLALFISLSSLIVSFINTRLVFAYISSKTFVFVFIVVIILLILLSIRNAKKIQNNEDKVYKNYQKFKDKKYERIKHV